MCQSFLSRLLCIAVLLGAGTAAAQTRTDTGRHRPPEPEPEPAPEVAAETLEAGDSRWYLTPLLGMAAGSDLFRVEVVNGTPVPWRSLNPFRSDRFATSLETSFAAGLTLGYRLGQRWDLRADVTWSRMDVAAEAKVGQVGAVYLYDRWTAVSAALGVEVRLVRLPSYPYLGAALNLQHLGPQLSEGLAQTNLGGRLSLGYRQAVSGNIGLRLEGRVARNAFSLGDWRPEADQASQPDIILESEDALSVWELMLGVTLDL